MSDANPNLSKLSVLNDDGSRNHVHPADVTGRFSRFKPWSQAILIAIYVALPFVQVGGHPAVHIDIPGRQFFLFGLVFNAQDFYLAFFVLTGIGFTLIFLSAVAGRLWCGWACPQTVFLEGVFRRIERWIDGPRPKRIKLQDGPWTGEKILKRAAKWGIYLGISLAISHVFLSYFVSLPGLVDMVQQPPAENMTVFLWMAASTGIMFFNFVWFREQLCLIICPYGRLQSALVDNHTVIIGYDEKRGEPRGKAKDGSNGDCVDCKRCIAVCPTGIDIRNGLQMECIGCANCIDACDAIMDKLGRPRGLVRYDSLDGLEGKPRRLLRPRLAYYALAGFVGLSVALFMFSTKKVFEANFIRLTGTPYVIEEGQLKNRVMLHVINKNSEDSTLRVGSCDGGETGVKLSIPQQEVRLAPLGSHQVPVVVEVPRDRFEVNMRTCVRVADEVSGEVRDVPLQILGPR